MESSQVSSSPMTKAHPPLEEMSLRQLRQLASGYNIYRYSRMRKEQLIEAILNIEKPNQSSPARAPVSDHQQATEAMKFQVGTNHNTPIDEQDLASVDEGLPDLPGGYGKSKIVMMPRDPQWSYIYWDVPHEDKENLRRQGGQQLALRLYDITNLNLETETPHSIQEYLVDELAREWYVPIPFSDRDYLCEIGYRCGDGSWLVLARSASVHTPPVYPSDWIEDHFIELNWEEKLEQLPEVELTPPETTSSAQRQQQEQNHQIYEEIFEMSEPFDGRGAGSCFGKGS